MTSVKKLVLVPIEEWDKIRKSSTYITDQKYKEVSVPLPLKGDQQANTSQEGRGIADYAATETATEPNPNPKPIPNPTPAPTAAPAPPRERKEKKEGELDGEKGEDMNQLTKYVEREETGKDQTREQLRKDAGAWRPPGIPLSAAMSQRTWIHL